MEGRLHLFGATVGLFAGGYDLLGQPLEDGLHLLLEAIQHGLELSLHPGSHGFDMLLNVGGDGPQLLLNLTGQRLQLGLEAPVRVKHEMILSEIHQFDLHITGQSVSVQVAFFYKILTRSKWSCINCFYVNDQLKMQKLQLSADELISNIFGACL